MCVVLPFNVYCINGQLGPSFVGDFVFDNHTYSRLLLGNVTLSLWLFRTYTATTPTLVLLDHLVISHSSFIQKS